MNKIGRKRSAKRAHFALFSRLLRSEKGNVAWLVALSIVPILAIIGSAVDISRLYAAQMRLQQACDAGALAARKAMDVSPTLSDAAAARGKEMFRFNFPSGTYQSRGETFIPTKASSNEIKGDASVTVPMTFLQIFRQPPRTLTASCTAIVELSNVDIMFVLDTTGSMEKVNSGDRIRRIQGLRNAVMSFFDTLSVATTAASRVRYGFVPYSSNVNVGRLLYAKDHDYMIDNGIYQGRTVTCSNYDPLCWFPTVEYKPMRYSNMGGLLASQPGAQSTIRDPDGNTVPVTWNGCIEEIQTVAFAPWQAVPADAKDLDINFIPSTSDTVRKWKPHLPEITFNRFNRPQAYTNSSDTAACPSPARRLESLTKDDRPVVQSYANNLDAIGATYHDIGMIWGARLIAPVGIFGMDNRGSTISRNIIFMTDGELAPQQLIYNAYGVEQLERRIQGSSNDLYERHRMRFRAACEAAKTVARATVWVVSFGDDAELDDDLKKCASPGLAFHAANSAELNSRFKDIAKRISKLRLSQ